MRTIFFWSSALLLCGLAFGSQFSRQSATFGTPLSATESAAIWGGENCYNCIPCNCLVAVPNGACNTVGESTCPLGTPNCSNFCYIKCSAMTTYVPGLSCMSGVSTNLPPCAPFQKPGCELTGSECGCSGPTTPWPCGPNGFQFNSCST